MLTLASWAVALLIACGSCHDSQHQVPFNHIYDPPIARVPADEWQRLNQSVGGRLLTGLPVGLPCYNNFNGNERQTDKTACAVVEKNRNNTNYLTSQMTGYTQGNWGLCQSTGSGCPTSPVTDIKESAVCDQGAIPDFYVDVRSISDVEAALKYANQHDIPVVVKNSGHDYKGRSAGPGSLGLWVHNYKPEPKLEKGFVPDGCTLEAGDVITFGAGQGFAGLYAFADQNDVTIVGGSSATVAPAGGWITGGGHSGLSPVYGLGVDNVQQVRVVLPNGTYVTANHCQNQDIFFAIRGGGGGTFGVNMEMSMLAHPKVTLQFVDITFPRGLNDSMNRQLLTILVENANAWFDAGWGGYAYPAGTRPDYPVMLMNPLLNAAEAAESMAPLLDFAKSLGVPYQLKTFSSFYELYLAYIKDSLTMFGNYGISQTSRLIPRANFEGPDNQAALVETLADAVSSKSQVPMSLMLLLTTPSRDIQDSDSSITPAWRDSTWHAIYTTAWDPTTVTPAQVLGKFTAVTESMDPLRAITPNGGAYLNEGDTYEPDPVAAFWGDANHERLLKIKSQLDPQNIMQVHQGIGSISHSPLLSCYPPVRNVTPRDEL